MSVLERPLLACVSCGEEPSLTSRDARCGCSLTAVLRNDGPVDYGPVRCSDCGRAGATIDGQCFVCAGVLDRHARGD
jgi:hypothetical protein